MKALKYIRYFLYIAWNWHLRLALFTIYHEIRGELKYHLDTTGTEEVQNLHLQGLHREDAEVYQGASYYLLEKLFAYMQTVGKFNSMIDFGAGKGRVMIVAAAHGFKRVTGVEFAAEIWQQAVRTVDRQKSRYPDTSFFPLHENAAEHRIDDETQVFFFFNPFKDPVMRQVLKNILASGRRRPRKLYVLYTNPQLKHLFQDHGFKEIFYLRPMNYVEASILLFEPENI